MGASENMGTIIIEQFEKLDKFHFFVLECEEISQGE
jgi:hypothetical protein